MVQTRRQARTEIKLPDGKLVTPSDAIPSWTARQILVDWRDPVTRVKVSRTIRSYTAGFPSSNAAMDWRFHRQACLTSIDYHQYLMLQGSDVLAHVDPKLAAAWRKGQALSRHHNRSGEEPFVGAKHTETILTQDQDMGQSFKYALTAGPRHWGVAIPRDPFTLLNFNLSQSPVYTAFLRHIVDLVRQGRKVLVFAIHPWVQLYVFLRPTPLRLTPLCLNPY